MHSAAIHREARAIIRVSRHFGTTCERIFDAWLDAATAGKWLFATPTGKMTRVEMNAHVGGSFTITEARDGAEVDHVGEYLEIDRPHHLSFNFAVPSYSEEYTTVSIDIASTDAGCNLALTHTGVLREYANQTEAGWNSILDALAAHLKA